MLRRCVCEHGTHGDLPDVEWVKRGRVRLFPTVGTKCLHPWKPARLSLPSMSKKSVMASSSSSMGTWQEKIAATEQRVKERWEEEQTLRRRLRTRPPDDFKRRLDELMEDENGPHGKRKLPPRNRELKSAGKENRDYADVCGRARQMILSVGSTS